MPSSAAPPAAPPTPVSFRRLAEHRPPGRSRVLRLVPGPAASSAGSAPAPALAPVPVPPPSRTELRRLLGAVLEILDGRRPARQLDELLPLSRQRILLGGTARVPGAAGGARRLRSVHPARIAAGVVELCGTVEQGDRARALVARLELRGGRWRFTLITLV